MSEQTIADAALAAARLEVARLKKDVEHLETRLSAMRGDCIKSDERARTHWRTLKNIYLEVRECDYPTAIVHAQVLTHLRDGIPQKIRERWAAVDREAQVIGTGPESR